MWLKEGAFAPQRSRLNTGYMYIVHLLKLSIKMLVNTYLQYTVGGKLIIIVQMSKLKKSFLGECATTENPLDIDTSIKLLNLTT